jgi:hypothetical protein
LSGKGYFGHRQTRNNAPLRPSARAARGVCSDGPPRPHRSNADTNGAGSTSSRASSVHSLGPGWSSSFFGTTGLQWAERARRPNAVVAALPRSPRPTVAPVDNSTAACRVACSACPRRSFPPPILRERRHRSLARRFIAMRRRTRYAAGGGGGGFGGLGAAASVALAAAWATHLTDSITSSARPGHPPFAERNIMERARGSFRLDASELDYLAPLLGFLGNEGAELGGRSRKRRSA